MSWKNSEQARRCLVRRLPDFELWAYLECGAGKRPGMALRNFRTSLLFSCFPLVWGSSESWQNTSGSQWNRPQDVCCLFWRTWANKPQGLLLFCLFICLHDITRYLSHTLWGCLPSKCKWIISLKVHPKALHHVCQYEGLHKAKLQEMMCFSEERCV